MGEVGDDDAAYGVGVDEAGVEDKGDEVVAQDCGVEVEIQGDLQPGGDEGGEAEEGGRAGGGVEGPRLEDVEDAASGVGLHGVELLLFRA